ncbi:MAG TPA: pyruvate dehydrogenase complex E1 component subunit beta [Candidatus Dormibacteraeota bacterium]|nr:pyruvate dehydrogenase complex E1 component subunit beta [Candidatus Dormibacteraeota bacterium]
MQSGPVKTMRQALNEALFQEMARDASVFVIGEDVGRHGGARGVSKGLWDRFGASRVIDTPISEMAIAGICSGAAMSGLRPVAEVYIGDIILYMADSIVTTAARLYFSTEGRVKAPYVIRGADGGRPDGGPHQDTFASWFAHVPGIKVVIPSTPADAKGLLTSAIRDDNPVIFLEPHRLYDDVGPVPEGEYTVPIGRADVRAPGSDVTVVTVGQCVKLALEAREHWAPRGVSVEVVDLRSLRPLDVTTIRESVAKTGRLVVAHEGWASYGIGAEIVASVCEPPHVLLRAPAVRVGTLETHIPASHVLASAILPSVERIDVAISQVMACASSVTA